MCTPAKWRLMWALKYKSRLSANGKLALAKGHFARDAVQNVGF